MKKLLWFLLLLAIVGGGLYFAFGRNDDETTAVTTQAAERGDITSVVTATGRVYPEVEVSISSEVAGEIVNLPVSDGQKVAKGDLLVSVNPDTLLAQVKQQEAALRAAKANAAEAAARLAQAELDLERMENLFAKGFATQEQVDAMSTAHEVAVASKAATEARIEQQEMALKEARDTLAKATLFSPIDGRITALSSELGDRVVGTGQFEGTEIMRVANLENMEVRVDVSEADIVAVAIGDKATIEIDALPNRKFEGHVTEVANSASIDEEDSQDQLTTFQVKIKLIQPGEEIRPGMTATADIQTETVTDVIKVPLQSVTVRSRDEVISQIGAAEPATDGPAEEGAPPRTRQNDNLQRVVFVVENGQAVMKRVETGIADNRSIEIKSGVEEGDQVVTGSYRVLSRELVHGAPVTVETPASDGFRPEL